MGRSCHQLAYHHHMGTLYAHIAYRHAEHMHVSISMMHCQLYAMYTLDLSSLRWYTAIVTTQLPQRSMDVRILHFVKKQYLVQVVTDTCVTSCVAIACTGSVCLAILCFTRYYCISISLQQPYFTLQGLTSSTTMIQSHIQLYKLISLLLHTAERARECNSIARQA
jgi:hypothetical protein